MKANLYFISVLLFSSVGSFSQTDQELLWGSYFGVPTPETQAGETVDDIAESINGSFAIVGQTQSLTGLATGNAHQPIGNGSFECFLAYFDEDREQQWSTYFGGSGMDTPTGGLEALTDGSIVIAGTTTSDSNIATEGSYLDEANDGNFYGFLSRFSTTGELMWSTYLGPPTEVMFTVSEVRDIHVMANDDIVVNGVTLSSEFPVSEGVMQTEHQGGWDTFICRFNSGGELLWSTF